ncbi:PAS domain-containing sensor histidine kinase [Pedobacter sp. V48]|uniref:PAS domain-containing sensor histidine kinase n=1 Tax=Pedobacter sp. V48 TaxID=509635 RepID=UPI0003E568CA|nr:PAS domain-containing sensor histidine kinase [Pedobacter sp. V48]ETZ20381.1 hypothetical protein N824_05205 [Pedobacter sp. V48]
MHYENTKEQLEAELAELRHQLEEATDTIEAIRTGMVDALVVQGVSGHQVYTLKSADRTFRVLIEKMQQGAITLNSSGVILYCNSYFADMCGITLDEIIGRHFDEFIGGYTAEKLSLVLSSEGLRDYKTRELLTTNSGKEMPVQLSFTNLDMEDGTALSIICTDLTQQIEAQNKAADLTAKTEMIKRKDEFISIASHELKTPMTSLKAYLQLISRYSNDNIPDQFTMLIAKASGSLNKLEILVNDLLDVSKIQAGKLNFSKTKVEVSSLVRICVENAGYMFPDFKLIFDAEGDFFVLGNQERLEQVVMNMISNAVKYSPENLNAFIKIFAEGSMVRIAVTDYGIGMTELQLEKIFDRFYRVDEASVMAGGLGMGLYICEEIVKSHEGKMGVTSNFGQGSTFYVLLPLIS